MKSDYQIITKSERRIVSDESTIQRYKSMTSFKNMSSSQMLPQNYDKKTEDLSNKQFVKKKTIYSRSIFIRW